MLFGSQYVVVTVSKEYSVEQNGQKTKSDLIPEYFSTEYSVHINAFIKAES